MSEPAVALFAYNRDPNKVQLMPDRALLFDDLRDRGVRPLVSSGAEAAFGPEGVDVHELGSDGIAGMGASRVPHSVLDVVVNRIDRSIDYDLLPPGVELPTVINPNDARSLGHRRLRVAREVLEPLGLGIPTAKIDTAESVLAFLQDNPASEYVIKPNEGTRRRPQVFSAHDLRVIDRSGADAQSGQIIQPGYTRTDSFPNEVRPFRDDTREVFDELNAPGYVKDLRVYGFHSPQATTVFPVARARGAEDVYFFVDPQSVPELLEDARRTVVKAAAVSGAAALYGVVDFVYGRSRPDESNAWRIYQVGCRFPRLLGAEVDAEVAGIIRGHFADQVAQTAGGLATQPTR